MPLEFSQQRARVGIAALKSTVCRMSSRVKPGGGGQRERDAHARPGRCKLPADLLLSLSLSDSQ